MKLSIGILSLFLLFSSSFAATEEGRKTMADKKKNLVDDEEDATTNTEEEDNNDGRELFIDYFNLRDGVVYQRTYIAITEGKDFKTLDSNQQVTGFGKFRISDNTVIGLTEVQSGGIYDPVDVQIVNRPHGVSERENRDPANFPFQRTQAPTLAPTETPSEAPTTTKDPTESPSTAPPTQAPSDEPTKEASDEPTDTPSDSQEPTQAPTFTEEPTESDNRKKTRKRKLSKNADNSQKGSGLNIEGQQFAGGAQPKFIPARDPGFFFDGQCTNTGGKGSSKITKHSCLFNLCLGGGGYNCLALYCGGAYNFDPLDQPGNTFQNPPNLPPSYPCIIMGGTNTFQGATGSADITTLTGQTSPIVKTKTKFQFGAITQRINVVSNKVLPPAP